jgi:hypothetical protein
MGRWRQYAEAGVYSRYCGLQANRMTIRAAVYDLKNGTPVITNWLIANQQKCAILYRQMRDSSGKLTKIFPRICWSSPGHCREPGRVTRPDPRSRGLRQARVTGMGGSDGSSVSSAEANHSLYR